MTPARLLTFEHDEDAEGWCSLCTGPAVRGVWIQPAKTTGGTPQAKPSFDEGEDRQSLAGPLHYRIGTCCIGKMIGALERRGLWKELDE